MLLNSHTRVQQEQMRVGGDYCYASVPIYSIFIFKIVLMTDYCIYEYFNGLALHGILYGFRTILEIILYRSKLLWLNFFMIFVNYTKSQKFKVMQIHVQSKWATTDC